MRSPVDADGVAAGSLLGRLDDTERDALLAIGRRRRYPAHSIVCFAGDPSSDVFVVCRGDLTVSIAVDDRDVVLDILGPGDVAGELALVDRRPRSATLTTLGPAELAVIPLDALEPFLDEHPRVRDELWAGIADRLRRASARQAEHGALDATGRVCARLVELADRYGVAVANGVSIAGPLTQRDLAAWAGLSREAVVRALHDLRGLGWLSTSPRAITVHDLAAVTARAALPQG